MVLNPDFKEFIESLNVSGVRYLVVGGYAVAFHGHPRYTKDLDVWIESTQENAKNVIAAFDRFGFGSLGLQESDFMDLDKIIQVGFPPNRIDILTSISGVDFSTCYQARDQVEIDGILVSFINLDHLKKNKAAAGRYQDLADLENLV